MKNSTQTIQSSDSKFLLIKQLYRWMVLIVPVSLVIGSMVALFLWLLTLSIHYRFAHKWLLYLLPLAGVLIHFIYKAIGSSSEKGNNLIIDEIHQPGGGVPKQMMPIILVTTIITHLFGGSAGREGTAVQMGGSIAAMFGNWLKVTEAEMRILLIAGIAAGFGAVFGTPLTGAIFAIEVLTIGRVHYKALIPALIASFTGDYAVASWGVHHTAYHIDLVALANTAYLPFNLPLVFKVVIASVAFGLVSYLFAVMVHQIKAGFLKIFKVQWLIPVAGGLIIIALTYALGKPDYLSLGVDAEYPGSITIPSAFYANGADTWSWLWKTVYTTITLATGFKGGEVTPLFYIGATLGNTLAALMNSPAGLFAGLGFIAVFAGATKTPLACTLMGVELFGSHYLVLFAIACFTAYFFSGHRGIYSSQQKVFEAGFHQSNYFSQKFSRYRANFLKKKGRV